MTAPDMSLEELANENAALRAQLEEALDAKKALQFELDQLRSYVHQWFYRPGPHYGPPPHHMHHGPPPFSPGSHPMMPHQVPGGPPPHLLPTPPPPPMYQQEQRPHYKDQSNQATSPSREQTDAEEQSQDDGDIKFGFSPRMLGLGPRSPRSPGRGSHTTEISATDATIGTIESLLSSPPRDRGEDLEEDFSSLGLGSPRRSSPPAYLEPTIPSSPDVAKDGVSIGESHSPRQEPLLDFDSVTTALPTVTREEVTAMMREGFLSRDAAKLRHAIELAEHNNLIFEAKQGKRQLAKIE